MDLWYHDPTALWCYGSIFSSMALWRWLLSSDTGPGVALALVLNTESAPALWLYGTMALKHHA
jgi:hypothetical protein